MNTKKIIAILILNFNFSNVWAGDYEDAKLAIELGLYSKAIEKLKSSAKSGDSRAQLELGDLYIAGKHLKRNEQQGVKLIRNSAENGNAEAQTRLGFYYFIGYQHVEDYSESYKWYKLAAQQGYPLALSNLAGMYEKGIYVPKNDIRAHMWYNLAITASVNHKRFSDITDDWRGRKSNIEKRLTRQEITQAQNLARKCHEKNFKDCD